MAGTSITLEDAALQAWLRRSIQNLSHPADALAEIGEILVKSTQQRFATETNPDGERWAENSDVTLLAHLNRRQDSYTKTGRLSAKGARRIGAKKILTDRGYLGDLIRYQMEGTTAVLVGSDRKYAAVQQFGQKKGASGTTLKGAPIPWGDIPARPFLGVSDEDRRDIEETLAAYIMPGA
jgi:phage virion morphogenesis protein